MPANALCRADTRIEERHQEGLLGVSLETRARAALPIEHRKSKKSVPSRLKRSATWLCTALSVVASAAPKSAATVDGGPEHAAAKSSQAERDDPIHLVSIVHDRHKSRDLPYHRPPSASRPWGRLGRFASPPLKVLASRSLFKERSTPLFYPHHPVPGPDEEIANDFLDPCADGEWQDASTLVEEILDPFNPADRPRIAWLLGTRAHKGPPPLPRPRLWDA